MSIKLIYPVFALKEKDNNIYVFSKEKELKSTNTELLSKKVFKNVILIDSSRRKRKIKRAYKVKDIGFLGFNLFKKGKQILVDFEFTEDEIMITLEEFKSLLIKRIEKNKNYWKKSWDINELLDELKKSNSFEEIASLIK